MSQLTGRTTFGSKSSKESLTFATSELVRLLHRQGRNVQSPAGYTNRNLYISTTPFISPDPLLVYFPFCFSSHLPSPFPKPAPTSTIKIQELQFYMIGLLLVHPVRLFEMHQTWSTCREDPIPCQLPRVYLPVNRPIGLAKLYRNILHAATRRHLRLRLLN